MDVLIYIPTTLSLCQFHSAPVLTRWYDRFSNLNITTFPEQTYLRRVFIFLKLSAIPYRFSCNSITLIMKILRPQRSRKGIKTTQPKLSFNVFIGRTQIDTFGQIKTDLYFRLFYLNNGRYCSYPLIAPIPNALHNYRLR
jgi:hypothetical protein